MKNTKNIYLTLTLCLVLLIGSKSPAMAMAISKEDIPMAIENYMEARKGGTAGLALAVFEKGEPIYKKYYGYSDVENKCPVDEETVFEWGSVTKVITWVSVMQLVEEGKIDLNEDITNYLPQGFLTKLRYSEPITMLHLMNHQAGFQEILFGEYAEVKEIPELAQALRISEPSQIYAPGTVTAYSNYGAALAGYIVECVSGMPFYEYVNKNIFSVLNMKHTSIKPGWTDNPWVAKKRAETKSYSYYEDSKESFGAVYVHIALYPAGACAGTLNDFMLFAKEFTSANTKLFKKQSTMEELTSPSLYYKGAGDSRIHHGLWSIDYGTKLLGHGGNTQGFTSSLWFDTESKTGIVVMSNEVGEVSYNYGLLELLYGSPNIDIVPDEDITGIYCSKRGFKEGLGRIASYASQLIPIQKGDSEGKFKVSLLDFDIYSLGNGIYRQDSHNGLANNIYKVRDSNILESYTTDYEKLSIIEIATVAFLIIAALLVFIYGIVNSMLALINKLRKKSISHYALLNNIALTFAMAISAIFFYFWVFIDFYVYEKVCAICVFLMFAMLIVAANFIYQLLAKAHKKNSLKDMLKAAIILLPLITVLFFQAYKFWV